MSNVWYFDGPLVGRAATRIPRLNAATTTKEFKDMIRIRSLDWPRDSVEENYDQDQLEVCKQINNKKITRTTTRKRRCYRRCPEKYDDEGDFLIEYQENKMIRTRLSPVGKQASRLHKRPGKRPSDQEDHRFAERSSHESDKHHEQRRDARPSEAWHFSSINDNGQDSLSFNQSQNKSRTHRRRF